MSPKLLLPTFLLFLFSCAPRVTELPNQKKEILARIEHSMKNELLDAWYPRALDKEHGGYLSSFTFDFKPTGEQDKMIVSQSRHVWTNAKASQVYPDETKYLDYARHGFHFLKDVMWDKTHGGFHTLVDRNGNVKSSALEEKTAYGNAFGIYALAAFYAASQDTSALNLARQAFHWLERKSHDPVHKGYFQHMKRDGSVIDRDRTISSTAETGYKDQNSSIHLLEAFTELYQVWPDPLLKERLEEMLIIIRNTIVQPEGYMSLFFFPDWKAVSYRDSSATLIKEHYNLDHVSFGHDVETAYLMLEATHVLGRHNDSTTLKVAKRMVDHSLETGWDNETGGFFDGGYYYKDSSKLTVVKDTKNWWTQAEGLNTLLMMAELFPDDDKQYFEKFEKLWHYVDTYVIDHEHGEWYSGGLDKEPHQKTAMKGHIWKASYHQFRSLMNCSERLRKMMM